MPTLLIPFWRLQVMNEDGVPYAGALLYSWLSGTSTPASLYATATPSGAYSNPVVADASGTFPVLFSGGAAYRLEIRTAAGVVIFAAQDNINTAEGLVAALQAETDAIADNVAGITGNGATTTGITFAATQVVSANPRTLDDYEEGTWTPAITGSGGGSGQTYSSQLGTYIKIGSLVTAHGLVTLTAAGTITTDVTITGLPFAAESASGPPFIIAIDFVALGANKVYVVGSIGQGASGITVKGMTAAAASTVALAQADIGNTTSFRFTAVYRTA